MVKLQKKRVLVTGSNGMLGKDIIASFNNENLFETISINRKIDSSLIKTSQFAVDLTDLNEVKRILEDTKPDIIVHCAANVNVDNCEKNKEYTNKLNIHSTGLLAGYNSEKTRFIYISSDSVFDGKKGNFKEYDKAGPLNYYAYSKLEGEKIALKVNSNTLVLRANIYGFHIPKGISLVEWALDNLFKRLTISGFKDVYFNPLYTRQLSKIVYELSLKEHYKGILHTGCRQNISKYDFLTKLAGTFKFDLKNIESRSVDFVNFVAPRPKNTTLDIERLKNIFGYYFDIQEGLDSLLIDYTNFTKLVK